MTIKKPLVRIVDDDPDVLKAMRKRYLSWKVIKLSLIQAVKRS